MEVAAPIALPPDDALIVSDNGASTNEQVAAAREPNALTSRALANVLTAQVVAYSILFIAALLLRITNLEARPLAPAEAQTALAAWEFLNGKPVSEFSSPLLFTLDWLAFLLFGAFDLTARMLPAMLSAGLVFVPLLARKTIGNTGALIAAFLIAFSPALIFFGRTVSAVDLAVGGAVSALLLFWNYRESQNTRALYAAAILAGVALTADGTAYAILVAGALYWAVAWLWARRGAADKDSAVETRDVKFWHNVYVRAGALFALTYVLSATTFLLNRDGLGVAFNLFGAWLAAMSSFGAFTSPLNYLLVYEPIALIFGLAGVVLVWSFRGADAQGLGLLRMLSVVAVLTFLWYSIGGNKNASDMVAALFPLLFLAGWFIGNLMERARGDIQASGGWRSMLSGEIPIFIMLLLLSALVYFQVGAFLQQARFSPALDAFYRLFSGDAAEQSLLPALLTLGLITILLLAVFVGLSIVLVGVGRTMTLLALAVFTLLALGTVRATWQLNDTAQEPLREIIAPLQTPQHIRLLVRDLEWYSQIRRGDQHVMRIVADEKLGAVGRWYLRAFPNIEWTNNTQNALHAEAIVSPAPAPPPGNWMGQKYRVQTEWLLSNTGGIDVWKWLLYRQGGAETHQTTTLWLPTEQ